MRQNTRTAPSCHTNARRILGHTLVAAALAGALSLTGCMHHGAHTKAELNLAQKRMGELKSATEFQMGNQAFLAGDLPKALKHIDYSLELNPGVVKSHVLKGRILLEMSKIEDSAASLAKAQELDPKFVDAWYYQGLLAERIDRKDDALAKYTHAGELDPSNAQYAIAAAEMLIALNRVDEADTYLRSRREHFDHSAGVRQTLGHIAMLRNDPKTASTLFGEARLLAPDDTGVLEDLVRAQIANSEFGQAEYNLSRMLSNKDNAGRRDLQQMRARCLMQVDRPVDARDVLVALTKDQAAAADPDTWIALGQTALVLHDTGHLRQAAARAVALAPNRAEGYVLKAMYAKQTGNAAAAEENLLKAVTIDPTSENYVMLGLLQQEQGRLSEARASFQAALKVNPNDTSASRLLTAFAETTANPTP